MPLPTFSPRVDNADIIHAEDINELQREVSPIAAATLAARYSQVSTSTSITLTDSSYPLQSIASTATGLVTLPAYSTANHAFYIVNRSTSFTIDVKTAGAVQVVNVGTNSAATIYPDSVSGWKSGGSTPTREILSADRTYYVRADGNDANTGLVNNAGGAFLTIPKAIDTAASLDTSLYNVVIQVADGTYVANAITCKNIIGSGTITIQGNNGTPANVVIDGGFYKLSPGTTCIIKDLKLIKSSGSATTAIYSAYSAQIQYSNIVFSTGFTNHVYMYAGGSVSVTGNYEIAGGATYHWVQESQGSIEAQSITITLTGTPAFSIFLLSNICSTVRVYALTFSGSATGQRYAAQLDSAIQTFGGGANYFPGNSAGTTATGGQYA